MAYLNQRMAELFLDGQGRPLAYRPDYRNRAQPACQQATWLARSSRRTLSRLGRALVVLGERLERCDRMQRQPDLTVG